MKLINEGITEVSAREYVGGLRFDGRGRNGICVFIVQWKSVWDKCHRVYLNGEFAGQSACGLDRVMLIDVPASSDGPVRVEVFAVDENAENIEAQNLADEGQYCGNRVRIRLLHEQKLALGSRVQIYSNGGDGEVDYSELIAEFDIFEGLNGKCGFGLNAIGKGGFGYEFSGAAGAGRGVFGAGMFGADADSIEWTSMSLEAGVYKFAVCVVDAFSNKSEITETDEITVTGISEGAEELLAKIYGAQTQRLIFTVN